jgi:hypothetical protein
MKVWKPMPSPCNRQFVGGLACVLKITPVLDELDAKGAHGSVFLDAVPHRYDDSCRNTVLASGKSNGLAVISPRRGDETAGLLTGATQFVHIYKAAADLEPSDWRMVFVFHPHSRPSTRLEEWPPVLGGRGHEFVDQRSSGLELVQ